jgi:hypothetical protein
MDKDRYVERRKKLLKEVFKLKKQRENLTLRINGIHSELDGWDKILVEE